MTPKTKRRSRVTLWGETYLEQALEETKIEIDIHGYEGMAFRAIEG